jgi:aspartate oxidase
MAEKYNTSTHLVLEILVGAGIQQQSRALHVTLVGGPHQRRVIVLRAWQVTPMHILPQFYEHVHAHIQVTMHEQTQKGFYA